MKLLLIACAGGALGSGARYLLSLWVSGLTGSTFPWGTIAVNVIGSFALALVLQAGIATGGLSDTVRIGLATGVLGGFTTYSTFNYETVRYLQLGQWGAAATNVGLTLVACLVAGLLGILVARTIW